LQQGFGETWIGSTCLLNFVQPAADRIEQSLADCGVETRRWWGAGAHGHPATASFPRTAVPATDALARSTLAVPLYRDIGPAEISRVAEIVLAVAEVGR
jgi:dTDP-4-amino-4,6-dideoxygalactose transaminase